MPGPPQGSPPSPESAQQSTEQRHEAPQCHWHSHLRSTPLTVPEWSPLLWLPSTSLPAATLLLLCQHGPRCGSGAGGCGTLEPGSALCWKSSPCQDSECLQRDGALRGSSFCVLLGHPGKDQDVLEPADPRATSWEASMGVPSTVLLVSAWGAALGGAPQHPALVKDQWCPTNKPAKHKDGPTSGTARPWGWEWAGPWPSASLQGPGIPAGEEERSDSCKRGSGEEPSLPGQQQACEHLG